jgi:hypothetical protein
MYNSLYACSLCTLEPGLIRNLFYKIITAESLSDLASRGRQARATLTDPACRLATNLHLERSVPSRKPTAPRVNSLVASRHIDPGCACLLCFSFSFLLIYKLYKKGGFLAFWLPIGITISRRLGMYSALLFSGGFQISFWWYILTIDLPCIISLIVIKLIYIKLDTKTIRITLYTKFLCVCLRIF